MKLSAASSADVSGAAGSGGAACVVGGASTVTVGSSGVGAGDGDDGEDGGVDAVCGGAGVPGGNTSTSGRSMLATAGFDASIAFVTFRSAADPSCATGATCGGGTTLGPPISGFGTGAG